MVSYGLFCALLLCGALGFQLYEYYEGRSSSHCMTICTHSRYLTVFNIAYNRLKLMNMNLGYYNAHELYLLRKDVEKAYWDVLVHFEEIEKNASSKELANFYAWRYSSERVAYLYQQDNN